MPSLAPDLRLVVKETEKLFSLLDSWDSLLPIHRKVLAEIILVRLAIIIENFLKSIFSKLSCGADYLDGTAPIILAEQRSSSAAILAMEAFGRKSQRKLKWNDGREVRRNVEYILDNSDSAVRTIRNYGTLLTEVRYIRNHIVHRNDGTRRNFKGIVIKYYGAAVPAVTCGTLLLSTRIDPRCLIRTFIASARIMARDLTRG